VERGPASNSAKIRFPTRGDILSREYLLLLKSTSALSQLRIFERIGSAEGKEEVRRRKRRGSLFNPFDTAMSFANMVLLNGQSQCERTFYRGR